MFDRLIGNQRAKETLRRMLSQNRVPGALLFSGEPGLGTKLFAIELARALNCRNREGIEGCGRCSACLRIERFNSPDPDDRDAFKRLIWSDHRDVGAVRAYSRIIFVEAIRDLNREANYRPFEGSARVFLIERADTLNDASSNALLKTLEEAPSATHLILLTSRPSSLLPTIRSRCQVIPFAPMVPDDLERSLVEMKLRAGEDAKLAAHVSGGRPAVALSINLDEHRERRAEMLDVIEALTSESGRVRLLRAAEEVGDTRNKDEFEPRLDVLEALIHDLWRLKLNGAAAKITNYDLRDQLAQLSSRIVLDEPRRWLAQIEDLRLQLLVNINRRVATDSLFLSMARS